MTSIRPSMPGIQQTGPLQNVQRTQQPAKTETPKEAAPKSETAAPPQDENKTKTFDDTPIADVNAFPFEGEAKAADATSDIEGLFETDETAETDETDDVDDSDSVDGTDAADSSDDVDETDDADDPDDVDGADDVDEPEAPEIEIEEDEEEDEEGGPDFDEAEGGDGGEEAEHRVNIQPLLELLPQLREIQRFRVEETWSLYGA